MRMELDELVERGSQSEDKLMQEFVTGIQWLRLMRLAYAGGPLRSVKHLDRLGIPIEDFIEAYDVLTKAGMQPEVAFVEAALQQFEKRLQKGI